MKRSAFLITCSVMLMLLLNARPLCAEPNNTSSSDPLLEHMKAQNDTSPTHQVMMELMAAMDRLHLTPDQLKQFQKMDADFNQTHQEEINNGIDKLKEIFALYNSGEIEKAHEQLRPEVQKMEVICEERDVYEKSVLTPQQQKDFQDVVTARQKLYSLMESGELDKGMSLLGLFFH